MRHILSLIGTLIPRASATSIEQIGSGSPGIDDMWANLKSVFPHTDLGSGGLEFIVLIAINLVLRFIGGIAVLVIVYAGIRMMMTVSDESAHTEAKKIILYAVLGLILAMGADIIVLYVMNVVQVAAGG